MRRKAADKSLFPCQMGLKGKRLLFIYLLLYYSVFNSIQHFFGFTLGTQKKKKNQDGFDCFHTKGTYKI